MGRGSGGGGRGGDVRGDGLRYGRGEGLGQVRGGRKGWVVQGGGCKKWVVGEGSGGRGCVVGGGWLVGDGWLGEVVGNGLLEDGGGGRGRSTTLPHFQWRGKEVLEAIVLYSCHQMF